MTKPDPMEGFPSTVNFTPFGYARNTGLSPVTVHGIANYMDNSGPHDVALPDQILKANETRALGLRPTGLTFKDGAVNLSFTYAGPCSSLMFETGSVDATGSYVFEVEPEIVGGSWGRNSQFWQVGTGTDTMYTVWNPSAQAEDFIVTLYYDQGEGDYTFPVHLEPRASTMISMLEMIQKRVVDANGHLIPPTVRQGSMSINNKDPDLRHIVTFVVSSGIYNPVAGTCCSNPITCQGATSAEILPSTFSIPDGANQGFNFYAINGNGTTTNYTSAASWSSSSNLSVSPGTVGGVFPGSASLSATIANIPEYVAALCMGSCPTGSQGASASGSVTDVTPVISGISPDIWPAGATTTVTFTGQYFGTAPTLGFSPATGITYTLSSVSDTQIVASVKVASGTPNEGVAVTVTSNGYGGGFQNGGNGQSPTSAPANATVQTPLNYVEVTVIGWINAQLVTLPTGANPTLQANLNSSATCAIDVGTWSLDVPTADLTNSTDKAYAGAFLVKNSSNPQPPTSGINPLQYMAGGNYRLFNDYGHPTGSSVRVGITPSPCGPIPVPNFVETAQPSTYNGSTGTSPSGWKYQIAEGRVGKVGQTVNQLLNGVSSTPFVWSVIEFNSSGTPMYNNVSIFPSFSVYLNGVYVTTYNQSPVASFSSLNASYQLAPNQIP